MYEPGGHPCRLADHNIDNNLTIEIFTSGIELLAGLYYIYSTSLSCSQDLYNETIISIGEIPCYEQSMLTFSAF